MAPDSQQRETSLIEGLLWDLTRAIPSRNVGICDKLVCVVNRYGFGSLNQERISLLSRPIHREEIEKAMASDWTTHSLRWLVSASARPLGAIDTCFSPDEIHVARSKVRGYSGTRTGVVASAIVIEEGRDELESMLLATRDFLTVFGQGSRKVVLSNPDPRVMGLKTVNWELASHGSQSRLNEIYCRIIAHNLGRVVEASRRFGVPPDFE